MAIEFVSPPQLSWERTGPVNAKGEHTWQLCLCCSVQNTGAADVKTKIQFTGTAQAKGTTSNPSREFCDKEVTVEAHRGARVCCCALEGIDDLEGQDEVWFSCSCPDAPKSTSSKPGKLAIPPKP